VSRTLQFVATVEHPDHDEPVTVRGEATVDVEPGTDLRRVLTVLVQQLFAPIVVSVVNVLVEHWVRH
jgi:hypothetical protein